MLGDGVLLALEGAGWTLTADPAEPVAARRGQETFAPHPAIHPFATATRPPNPGVSACRSLASPDSSSAPEQRRALKRNEAPVDNRGLAYNLLDFLPLPNFLGGRGD